MTSFRRECVAMRDGTKIRRQREVTIKIKKGETEKQARRKLGITVDVQDTIEISGTEALLGI